MVVILTDTPSWGTRTIGAYRIATALRQYGIEVEVIDFISQWPFEELIRYLDQLQNVEWWGLSTRYQFDQVILNEPTAGKITQLNATLEATLFAFLRRRGEPVVLGGPNVEGILNSLPGLNLDYALIGYADIGVIHLHDHITQGKALKFSYVRGIKVTNCNIDYGDINLGMIDTELLDEDYYAQNDVFPIEISRGCIFHCAFCSYSHLGKRPGTYIRPKQDIKKEIIDRNTRYGATQFLFVDDTFNDCVEKLQMIREIREETAIPFEFWSFARLDLLAANRQMFDLIGECGWKAMTLGIETLNKTAGKSVGKGADPMRLISCLQEMKQTYPDLHIQANIIIGLPHDTETTVRETVHLFLANPHLVDALRVNVLRIENPHNRSYSSKISKDPAKYGYRILRDEQLNLYWQTDHFDKQSAKELRNELQGEIDAVYGNYRHWADLLDIERNGKAFDKAGLPLQIDRVEKYIQLKRMTKGLISGNPGQNTAGYPLYT